MVSAAALATVATCQRSFAGQWLGLRTFFLIIKKHFSYIKIMSPVEEVLKSLGLVPKDQVQWDPQDVRTKPFLNQVIRNQMPTLTATQRSRLLDRVGPHVAASLRDRLKGVSQSQLVDIARNLSTNEKF